MNRLASPLINLCVPALCLSFCVSLGTQLAQRDGWVALGCHVVPPHAQLGLQPLPPRSEALGVPSPSSPGMSFGKCIFPHHSCTVKRDKGLHGMAPFPSTSKPRIYRLGPTGCRADCWLYLDRRGEEGVRVCFGQILWFNHQAALPAALP